MIQGVKARWQRWVDRRIPRSDAQRLGQRNIFILPTGAGLVFGVLLLIMLITGINYQNSLIYLLTFLLGTVFVAAMHQTHRNLSGLQITLVQPGEGFAGDDIPFRFRAVSDHQDAIAISLSNGESQLDQQHVLTGESLDMTMLARGVKRGYLRLDKVRVETRFPFGLLKAWSWLRPDTPGIVFPRALTGPEACATYSDGDNLSESRQIEGHDHADIRPWRAGDLSQRVLWKRYARTGDMVIADWEGEQGNPHWLDYEAFPGVEQEIRLGYLTAQVLERSRGNAPFGLRLPGQLIEPDLGQQHTLRCLRALATFGLEPPREGGYAEYGSRRDWSEKGKVTEPRGAGSV